MQVQQLNGDNACTLITFFSRFKAHRGDLNTVAEWMLASNVECNFLNKSRQRLDHLLSQHYALTIEFDGRCKVLTLTGTNGKITNERVMKTLQGLSDYVENLTFDYHTQVKHVVDAGIDIVAEACEFLNSDNLRQIKADPIQFTGGDLTHYEIDFMGSAKMIIYPDANLFMPEHLEYIEKNTCDRDLWHGTSIKCKTLVSYRYECMFNILHELIHCVQTEVKQEDAKAWSAEHDASRIALVIMKAVSDRGTIPHIYGPGKEEEIALYVYDRVMSAHNDTAKVSKDHIEGYIRWRDSFGYEVPVSLDAFEFANDNITATDYFKYRIGLEAYLHELNIGTSTVVDLLRTYFYQRTGKVALTKVNAPDHLHVSVTL